MIIVYVSSDSTPRLTVKSTELDDFVTNIGNYTGITLTATFTCGTPIVQTYNTTDVVNTSKLFYVVAGAPNILYVTPQLFNALTSFNDGIYKLEIKFTTTSGYTYIQNCIFVDITTKCKVATLLQNIITENENNTGEKTSTIAHLLHYGLVNASNCGCNCDNMCVVYNGLQEILSDIDPQILSDCGC